MRFFAQSFNGWAESTPWYKQLGCFLVVFIPAVIPLGILGGIIYGAYWLGTQH